MPKRFISPIVAAVAAVAALSILPAQAATRMNFDGNWSVLIVTRSGPCDQAYRYGLSIHPANG